MIPTTELLSAMSYPRVAAGVADITVASPVVPASGYASLEALANIANTLWFPMPLMGGDRFRRLNGALVGNGADNSLVQADLYIALPAALADQTSTRIELAKIASISGTLRGDAVSLGRSHWWCKSLTISDTGVLGAFTAGVSVVKPVPVPNKLMFSIPDIGPSVGVLVCPALGVGTPATGVDVLLQPWR